MSAQPQIPNRLVVTPPDLYGYVDKALAHPQPDRAMRKVLNLAYGRGYTDGYRDGHTDAEEGHDEMVRADIA